MMRLTHRLYKSIVVNEAGRGENVNNK